MFFPGNFASTAINMLIKNTKTTRGEDAIDHLWKEISKHLQVPNPLHHTKVAEVNQAQRQSLGKRMHEEENNYQAPKETVSFGEAIPLPEDLYTRLLAKFERTSIVGGPVE
ncbi:hypothetical protein G6F51_012203 [Rhizopus arrhizus]|uniref:Uncharacterized protein n=1 Tax=Rhizopus oryzae TaxID=64495 RepID=A0A9P6XX19_RHIOR|nr:hypothetical protein G6F51_012203 [Rhizopus arrhizus]